MQHSFRKRDGKLSPQRGNCLFKFMPLERGSERVGGAALKSLGLDGGAGVRPR